MIADILEAVIDLFLELFFWEWLNSRLKKRIKNRFLRWAVEVLIYLLALTVLLLLIAGIYSLITK